MIDRTSLRAQVGAMTLRLLRRRRDSFSEVDEQAGKLRDALRAFVADTAHYGDEFAACLCEEQPRVGRREVSVAEVDEMEGLADDAELIIRSLRESILSLRLAQYIKDERGE